jgi:hypothetical protein
MTPVFLNDELFESLVADFFVEVARAEREIIDARQR